MWDQRRQLLQVQGRVDSRNTGSTAMSAEQLEVTIQPSQFWVPAAAETGPWDVVGIVASIMMATSPSNLLTLHNVVVC
ncbi:MAG: hypothetical protein GY696_01915 [Gammaproteobacteria bacterium]|nr:hypothetical protein [Gammaproteobacteria bacterium]